MCKEEIEEDLLMLDEDVMIAFQALSNEKESPKEHDDILLA